MFYTSNGHDHVQTLPVKPVSSVDNFLLRQKAGGSINLADAVAALYAVWNPFFPVTDSISGFESYTQADCASAPVLRETGDAVGLVGTSVNANIQWQQADFTFKSSAGGRGIFKPLEATFDPDQKDALSTFTSGIIFDLYSYLVGDDSWITARDNFYLQRSLNLVTKTNDALRKKYLNP